MTAELKRGEFLVGRWELVYRVSACTCGEPLCWLLSETTGKSMPLETRGARAVSCPDCAGARAAAPGERVLCQRCRSEGQLFACLNHWGNCPHRARHSRKVDPPGTPAP